MNIKEKILMAVSIISFAASWIVIILSILSTIQKYITNATYDYGDKNPKVIDTRISDD